MNSCFSLKYSNSVVTPSLVNGCGPMTFFCSSCQMPSYSHNPISCRSLSVFIAILTQDAGVLQYLGDDRQVTWAIGADGIPHVGPLERRLSGRDRRQIYRI